MSELKNIYLSRLEEARNKANKKVSEAQRGYDLLKDKNSDHAFAFKAMLDLYIEAAEVYNKAPSTIGRN